jgi:tryptophan-rich sensory protein
MGYASYLVGLSPSTFLPLTSYSLLGSWATQPYFALGYYGLQFIPNFAWSPLFFKYRKWKYAAIDSAALFVLLIPTTISFWKADKFAGKLMVPYLMWVGAATVINIDVVINNDEKRLYYDKGVWIYKRT